MVKRLFLVLIFSISMAFPGFAEEIRLSTIMPKTAVEVYKHKSADTDVNGVVGALMNDPDLYFTIAPGEKWQFELVLLCRQGNALNVNFSSGNTWVVPQGCGESTIDGANPKLFPQHSANHDVREDRDGSGNAMVIVHISGDVDNTGAQPYDVMVGYWVMSTTNRSIIYSYGSYLKARKLN